MGAEPQRVGLVLCFAAMAQDARNLPLHFDKRYTHNFGEQSLFLNEARSEGRSLCFDSGGEGVQDGRVCRVDVRLYSENPNLGDVTLSYDVPQGIDGSDAAEILRDWVNDFVPMDACVHVSSGDDIARTAKVRFYGVPPVILLNELAFDGRICGADAKFMKGAVAELHDELRLETQKKVLQPSMDAIFLSL